LHPQPEVAGNSYQGIMMSAFGGSSVADVYGTVLKRGIVLKSSCELCSCYNVRFNSDYWTRLPEAAMNMEGAAAVHQFIMDELVAVQVGKGDGLSFYNASLAGSKTPVLVKMVELARPSIVTRWRVHGAGTFLPSLQNMAEAELWGSSDGSTYFKMAAFRNNRHDWIDMPVTCEQAVRFVRLLVIKGEGPGTSTNRARIAQFDVFGYGASP
jgi:hypothetical protein